MPYIKALGKAIASAFASQFTSGAPLNVTTNSSLSDVTIRDATTSSQKLKVNANGSLDTNIDKTGLSTETTLAAVQTAVETRVGATNDSAASSQSATASLAGIVRGLWVNFGLIADAASATGTLLARIRNLSDVLGTVADAASSTGSLMARVRTLATNSRPSYVEFSQTAVTIGTSLTTLVTVDVRGRSWVGVQLENTGATALNALQLQFRWNSSLSDWHVIASSEANFTTGNAKQSGNYAIEIQTSGGSGTFATMAAGGKQWLRFRCEGAESVRIVASVTSGTTTMIANGCVE